MRPASRAPCCWRSSCARHMRASLAESDGLVAHPRRMKQNTPTSPANRLCTLFPRSLLAQELSAHELKTEGNMLVRVTFSSRLVKAFPAGAFRAHFSDHRRLPPRRTAEMKRPFASLLEPVRPRRLGVKSPSSRTVQTSYACAREGHAPRAILLLPRGSLPRSPMSAKACFRSSLDNAAAAQSSARVSISR